MSDSIDQNGALVRNEALAWDGQVAQVFPQNVEKLPLYHWRYGQRMLCVGSRDGAAYDQKIDLAEKNTFHRSLTGELLRVSYEKLGTHGVCVCMSASLWFPKIMGICKAFTEEIGVPLLVVTPGFGDPALLEQYLPLVDAWVLMLDHNPGPLSAEIMARGAHVEAMWGLTENIKVPDLPWSSLNALHLRPRTALQAPDELHDIYAQTRRSLPQDVIIYDDIHQHSVCNCGETLIWRQGGRSRFDCFDPASTCCTSCGTIVPWSHLST